MIPSHCVLLCEERSPTGHAIISCWISVVDLHVLLHSTAGMMLYVHASLLTICISASGSY
jgi:hypothetical protein